MPGGARPAHARWTHLVACAVVTTLACAYLASVAWKGWIPFDDGMLAQAAQRVLEGQLPHLDFADVYTGGLSFFHAAAFRVGGSSLGTLRATLLVTTTASIPFWYYVASRFTPPVIAGVVALAAFAWSVPNYPAAMPSWYNLILAIVATAAMLRFLDTRHRRWILAAGLCAGVSILVKIIGVYLVAALALFLLHAVTSDSSQGHGHSASRRFSTLAALAAASVLALAPFALVRAVPDARSMIELALPPAIVAVALILRAASRARHGWLVQPRQLVDAVWPLAVGVAIPIVLFAIVYWRAGALQELFRGVFVLPRLRFADPTMHTPGGPSLAAYAFTVPLVLAFVVRSAGRAHVGASIALFAACAAVVVLSLIEHRTMVAAWLSARLLMLPVAIIVANRVLTDPAASGARRHHDSMVLICCVAAWCSLTQFPYSAPIYFSYVAPLVLMAAAGLAVESGRPAPAIGIPLVLGYGAFALAVRPQLFPRRPELSPVAARIDLPRGGIYVWPAEQRQYAALVKLVRHHDSAPWILALPDAPEVYFLSGYRNPTRAMYDVFEDTTNRTNRLLALAGAHAVQVVVINRDPQVSAPIDRALNDSLTRRYPSSQTIGPFEVRWR